MKGFYDHSIFWLLIDWLHAHRIPLWRNRWKTSKISVFPHLLANTRRTIVIPIVKKLSIAVPLCLYLNANRNFRYCENTRDLADCADDHPPLKFFDRGVGILGTWPPEVEPTAWTHWNPFNIQRGPHWQLRKRLHSRTNILKIHFQYTQYKSHHPNSP